MNWKKFLPVIGEPTIPIVSIPIRQLGISKVVTVRTRKNGGIRTIQIPVLFE